MRAAAALLVLAFVPALGMATPVRLDDSASPRSRFDVKPRWAHAGEVGDNPERMNAMLAQVPNLEVRLNTAKYVGKTARIWMVVPDFVPGVRSPNGLRVEWRTRGTLFGGSALPGTRTVVYDGVIRQAFVTDFLDLTLHLDARYLERGVRFEPTFEIDVAP
ncbi:MAG: hypothetical protein IPL06_15435 [Betaproteobacteria bacterium]|nr:hypothetical protein [Betaproteobacteria bacterium]